MPVPLAQSSALFLPLAGVLGLILGSFATCAGHRLARGGSVLSPARSYCPACGHTLTWRENIPLLGWLAQAGRCRFCQARIPARYPLTELANGAFALCAMAVFGPTPHFLAAVCFATLFLVLSLIDLETCLLPDALTLPGAAAALACSLLLPPLWTLGIGWQAALWGGLFGGGGLWLVSVVYRRVRGVDGLGLAVPDRLELGEGLVRKALGGQAHAEDAHQGQRGEADEQAKEDARGLEAHGDLPCRLVLHSTR